MMKTTLSLLILSILFLAKPSEAQKVQARYFTEQESNRGDANLEPITSTENIKLVGRGVHVKGSTQGLVLSCLTPSCQQLRFIYMTKDQRIFYVGPTYNFEAAYDVGTSVNDEALESNAKAVMTKVLKRVEHKNSNRGVLFLIAGGIASGLLVPVLGPVPLYIFLGGTGLIALSNDQGAIIKQVDVVGSMQNKFVSDSRDARLFYDKNGWNWSEKPKKVSWNTFMDLQHAIYRQQAAWDL